MYLKSYLQNWLLSRRNEVRPRTFEDYTRNINLLTQRLGRITLSALTPDHIERASAQIIDAGTFNMVWGQRTECDASKPLC